MAINNIIRENLPEDSVIFDNHAYDNSIIGLSTDGRVVYDFNKMVKEIMDDEGWTEEEAIDWVDYNTVRALSYMGDKSPIICEGLQI